MVTNYGSLDASIQEQLDADTDFAASLDSLSDEEKDEAIETKKSELYEKEVGSLKETADKAKKAEELANNYKTRAEKAEAAAKAGGKKPEDDEEVESDLSQKDLYALIKAEVPEEDIDDVAEYAALKKISVADALKSNVVKTILAEKAEFRKTAEATSAGRSKRVVSKVDDSKLLADLSKGEVPDEGSAEAERLFWARRGGKK